MDLTGRTLGNYDILKEIGRGGMAVVYRAYQRSLNRHVAIKVLPPYMSHDREFVERFQREARASAQLRHPNIVVIHDVAHQYVGPDQDMYYIVMELLEGRTLKQVVEQEGALPVERAARIVEQVASALDYAHQRGLIHRDVKPANIFVGKDDHATLTDFGIAKAASEAQQLTRTGMLMGTPEYMSPEQAGSGEVDHRTDLYALGVVAYQMLCGRVPFRGTTPHAVLHNVIYEPPPPLRQLRPELSPGIEAAVMKAIDKRPERRYQSGAELVAALKPAPAGLPPIAVAAPPAQAQRLPARRRSPVAWIVAALAAVLVLLLAAIWLLLDGGSGQETPTAVATAAVTREPATATAGSTSPEPVPTSGPTSPPTAAPPTDTPLPPTATLPAPAARFGRLAFSSDRDGNPEIYVVNLAGGSPVRLTQNSASDWLPDWSPDGTKIAFTSYRTGSYDLWVMGADGSAQTPWVSTSAWDEYARWAPDGQRLSLSTTADADGVPNSEIFVRRADGSLRRITFTTAEDQWADWSPDGRIIFAEGPRDGSNWNLYIVSPDGSSRTTWLDDEQCNVQPAWSPGGDRIAFLRITNDTNGNGRIEFDDAGSVWVGSASGGGLRRLTSGVWALTPTWSPDGQWIAFAQMRDSNDNGRSDQNDVVDIWAVPVDGGEAVPLVESPYRDGNPAWTW